VRWLPFAPALLLAVVLFGREVVLEVQGWMARRNGMRRPEPSNVVDLRGKAR
jgi:hypothetical protein